jgi:Fic family protein
VDDQKLNQNPNLLREILRFAFSDTRFEAIQLQNHEISPRLNQELLSFEERSISQDLRRDMATFQQQRPQLHGEWIKMRTNGSSSLNETAAMARWEAADSRKTSFACRGSFELGHLKLMHKSLTSGEQGVNNPGKFRTGVVRIGGAGPLALPPPPRHVERLMSNYEDWLIAERIKCDSRQKSVILTAAQAYQRLVTIHPFENGNGRVSRLIMDHVLESFGLPPAVLGEDVLDALFCLNPKSAGGEAFVRKVYEGVQQSYKMIHE